MQSSPRAAVLTLAVTLIGWPVLAADLLVPLRWGPSPSPGIAAYTVYRQDGCAGAQALESRQSTIVRCPDPRKRATCTTAPSSPAGLRAGEGAPPRARGRARTRKGA